MSADVAVVEGDDENDAPPTGTEKYHEMKSDDDDDDAGQLVQRLLQELSLASPSATFRLPSAATAMATAASPAAASPLALPAPAIVMTTPHLQLPPTSAALPAILQSGSRLATALIEHPKHGASPASCRPAELVPPPHVALPRELRSSSLTQCGDRVDFIAPADNMKQFFKLLHEEGAISLAVHRVGDSLVLEGLEAVPSGGAAGGTTSTPPKGAPSSSGVLQLELRRKSLEHRFLTYSMAAAAAPAAADPAAGEDVGRGGVGGGGAAPSASRASSAYGSGDSDASDVLRAAVAAAAVDADVDGTCPSTDDDDDDDDDDEREAWMPPRRPPRGFRRVVQWQLDDLSLLLGSDTVVFRSDEQVPTPIAPNESLD